MKTGTIPTASINSADALISEFREDWTDGASRPLLVRISGHYGSGKTHLMAWMIDTLKTGASPVVLRAACAEEDVRLWFRSRVAPSLRALLGGRAEIGAEDDREPALRAPLTELYAAAAAEVAGRAKLTESLVSELASNPARALEIVERNLLNSTAVQERFQSRLRAIARDIDLEVLAAVVALNEPRKAEMAIEWLCGEELEPSQLSAIRVSRSLTTEHQIADVLAVFAAISATAECFFILAIDEFEHFARYDQHNDLGSNATWLKRLLESLSETSAVVLVAGHNSAWKDKADLLDRFTAALELLPLTGADVAGIVEIRSGQRPFSQEVCEAVVEATSGNIRRVLSICRLLFTATGGSLERASVADVWKAASALHSRIESSDVQSAIYYAAERAGLSVRRGETIDGIPFDVIAGVGGDVRLVATVEHGVTEDQTVFTAARLRDRYDQVVRNHRRAAGVFVLDGAVNERHLADVQRSSSGKCVWVNLQELPAITRLEELVAGALAVAGSAAPRSAEQREADRKVEKAQNDTLKEAAGERARMQAQGASADVAVPQKEEINPHAYETFKELTQHPFATRLVRSVGGLALQVFGLLALMLIIFIAVPDRTAVKLVGVSDTAFEYWSQREPSRVDRSVREARGYMYAAMACVALIGLYFLSRNYRRYDRFFERRTHILRQMYLRSNLPADLLVANDLVNELVEKLGPVEAWARMPAAVVDRFPSMASVLGQQEKK